MKKLLILIIALIVFNNANAQENAKWNNIPDDIKNSKVFKRFAWDYNQRAFPYDTIPHSYYANEMNRVIQKLKNSKKKSSSFPAWESIGPHGVQSHPIRDYWGVLSGRVKCIAIHPNDPETVFIGAASGGIWKTIDGGDSWMDIGADLESLNFGAIAIDPENPNIVYAGSGESIFFSGTINFYGRGLFKSEDGGDTWIQINDGIGELTFFSDLAVSPHNSDLILGAMASGSVYLGGEMPNEGIWRSSDAGYTWIRTLDVLDAYDILFHPTNPDVMFAAVGGMNSNAGFYISNDQGQTWTQFNNGLQDENTIARMQIDISLTNTNIIYAVIYQPGGSNPFLGISRAYKSEDAGNNWTQISVGVPLGGNYGGQWMDQGFYDLCIAVDPLNSDHVFIGNIELHETNDGVNYSPVRPNGSNAFGSLVHVDYHQLVYSPSNPNYLYIGCDGGIYKSLDGGNTASSKNEGLGTLQFYRIASHPTNSQVVIGGMQDNSNAMTFDGGSIWNQVTSGDGMECFFNYNNPDTIVYASIQNGRLMKSTNGGSSFFNLGNFAGAWITPFFVHPTESNTLFAASKNIFKSENGTNFQIIAYDVAPVSVSTMAQSPVNPDYMIFASGGGDSPSPDTIFLVKISTDGGYNWNDVTNNIPGETRWVSRVKTDPIDENTMYVLRTGFSAGNKLYKTTDLGETWTNISGDLPDLPCSDIFIDPDSIGHLYLANDLGVYLTKNGGENWEYMSEGMPFVPVFDFDFVKINGIRHLRAGTHGRSIYESNIDVQVGYYDNWQNSNTIGMTRIYPNPFNNVVTIEKKLTESENVKITIYNHLGVEVKVIVDKNMPKGKHQITWNAKNQPAGIYYCVLKTNKETQIMKMVKL